MGAQEEGGGICMADSLQLTVSEMEVFDSPARTDEGGGGTVSLLTHSPK